MKYGRSLLGKTRSGFLWVTESVWKVEHAFERVNADTAKIKNARMRIFALLIGIAAFFAILALFAARASLFSGISPNTIANINPAVRATLVDRNGELLATDSDNYRLYLDTRDMMSADMPMVRRALSQILPQVSTDVLANAFSTKGRTLLTSWLSISDRKRILHYGLPGLSFETQKLRDYPLGVTGASLIGLTQRGDKGLSGAEYALQDEILQQGALGGQVALSMDLRVQGALENELRAAALDQKADGAVGIVTNVRTGEVLALVSWPEFDLSHPSRYSDDEMKNRAAASVFEMGSVFKLFTFAVGLETGTASLNSVYDARTPFMIGSRKISDFHAENRILSLEDVFIKSSNIGSAEIARNVGLEHMKQYYAQMGLFRRADIELREVTNPILPKKWSMGTLASTAFGHAISLSPLSYAQAAGAVLNGGYMRPLTIRKSSALPSNEARIFSANTSRQMLDLMRTNVIKGTGGRANAPGLRVGGKTGTADKVINGKYATHSTVSSFAAVFPTDGAIEADRYLVFILFDNPQGSAQSSGIRTGGAVAAPVAGRVINRIAPFVGVVRKDDKFTSAHWDRVPVIAETATSAVAVSEPNASSSGATSSASTSLVRH